MFSCLDSFGNAGDIQKLNTIFGNSLNKTKLNQMFGNTGDKTN